LPGIAVIFQYFQGIARRRKKKNQKHFGKIPEKFYSNANYET
jgi:hypothetical protein